MRKWWVWPDVRRHLRFRRRRCYTLHYRPKVARLERIERSCSPVSFLWLRRPAAYNRKITKTGRAARSHHLVLLLKMKGFSQPQRDKISPDRRIELLPSTRSSHTALVICLLPFRKRPRGGADKNGAPGGSRIHM